MRCAINDDSLSMLIVTEGWRGGGVLRVPFLNGSEPDADHAFAIDLLGWKVAFHLT